jgi:hypothetical protein
VNWANVTNGITIVGKQYQTTIMPLACQQYYHLIYY